MLKRNVKKKQSLPGWLGDGPSLKFHVTSTIQGKGTRFI